MATIFQNRHGVFYSSYMLKGRQVRHSLGTRDEAIAKRLLEGLGPAGRHRVTPPAHHPERSEAWDTMVVDGLATSGGWLANLYQRTKDRAGSRGVPFRLSKEQLREIAIRSAGHCEFTGLRFSWERAGRFPPYAPSLDRIIPSTGYTAGNCRLVCYAANVALSDWGAQVALVIAAAMVRNHQ